MRAEDLLAGPRGRRLCHEVTKAGDDRVIELPLPLHGLRECCVCAMYWQEPDEIDAALARPPTPPDLRTVAEMIAADPATAWWEDPVALADQHVARYPEGRPVAAVRPVLSGLESRVRALPAEHARSLSDLDPAIDWRTVSGIWWSAPIVDGGVATTRSVGPSGVPVGLLCVEDPLDWTDAVSWPVRPATGVRVLELRGPTDWVEFVRRYPLDVSNTSKRADWWRATGRDGAWAMPNWPAVAEQWDGVHLTVAGYLTTAGRALDLDRDTATVLAGWAPDTTYWFRDVLALAAGPRTWYQRDCGDWQPSAG